MHLTKSHPSRPSRRPGAEVRPFLPVRRAYIDVLAEGRRKHLIHGLVEIDVTDARQALRSRAEAGRPLSFTAFVMHAVARAVAEDRVLQAYRRRNKLVLFDDVDINTQIEGTVAGQKIVKSLLVRAANQKTVEQITAEIRAAQRGQPADSRRYRGTLAFARISRPVRAVMWRLVMSRPELVKRFGGTVAISSIGMFGPGGGWGIPIGPSTLMITVGGIVTKPRYVDGVLDDANLRTLTFAAHGDGTVMSWDWQVHPKGWMRILGPLFGPLGGRMERRIWTSMNRYLETTAARPLTRSTP